MRAHSRLISPSRGRHKQDNARQSEVYLMLVLLLPLGEANNAGHPFARPGQCSATIISNRS
jgi:hypothetical protein